MIKWGALVDPADRAAFIKYLSASFPPTSHPIWSFVLLDVRYDETLLDIVERVQIELTQAPCRGPPDCNEIVMVGRSERIVSKQNASDAPASQRRRARPLQGDVKVDYQPNCNDYRSQRQQLLP
jgi:hypothetical protein